MKDIYIVEYLLGQEWKVCYGNEVIATFGRPYEAAACMKQLAMLSEEELQEVIKELRSDTK